MGEYEEFHNICFVDTLDHTSFEGKQMDLFAMSLENTERIKRQNDKTISVIIGNPPYNAKQEKFNQNNANRSYESIDKIIKATYIKEGKAQSQIDLYDMYVRFMRWASDRLNDNGIIAFVSNSSFIDALTFDGFRKVLSEEFSYIYTVDLGGNIRQGDKTGNVFNIMVGVAISFLVRKQHTDLTSCQIYYYKLEENTAKDKLDFLGKNKLENIDFTHIIPDLKYNWINQSDNDFNDLLPLIDKNVKKGKSKKAIFKVFSLGVATHRDSWVYDFNKNNLIKKIQYLITIYQQTLKHSNFSDKNKIQWDRELSKYLSRKIEKQFNNEQIILSLYRPFAQQYLYLDKHFNGMTYQWFDIYNKDDSDNKYISISGLGGSRPFHCLAHSKIISLDFLEKTQCLPLYTYDKNGNRQENITDWSLQQFRDYYNSIDPLQPPLRRGEKDKEKTLKKASVSKKGWGDQITKEDIFYYVYAVLHNPKYREKYELNLKREFPRIPFYDDFFKWVNWGKKLVELHLNYEKIKPYPLKRIDLTLTPNPSPIGEGKKGVKPKLKTDKIKHQIIIDEVTILTEIPPLVWEYKLGNRSALEWILDQYKEKKPKDATIAEKFNNYRFADYKETVINLLMRVTTVSVETMKIMEEMTYS
jgi:predicted helicase